MISNYFKGCPCKLTKDNSPESTVYGRIVGESERGSWGNPNGVRMFSIPKFCTPGGSLIETGLFYLYDLEGENWKKLKEFEEMEKDQRYLGLLDDQDLDVLNERAR